MATATIKQGGQQVRTTVSQFKVGEFFVRAATGTVFMVTDEGAVNMKSGTHYSETIARHWTVREPNELDTVVVRTQTAPKAAKVELELSMEEAETLVVLAAAIGGPSSGRRGHTDAIGSALRDAGVVYPANTGKSGNIYFGGGGSN